MVARRRCCGLRLAAALALLLALALLEGPSAATAQVDPPSYTQRKLNKDGAQPSQQKPKEWSSTNPQGSKVAAAAGS